MRQQLAGRRPRPFVVQSGRGSGRGPTVACSSSGGAWKQDRRNKSGARFSPTRARDVAA
jgi:hypothetical protein